MSGRCGHRPPAIRQSVPPETVRLWEPPWRTAKPYRSRLDVTRRRHPAPWPSTATAFLGSGTTSFLTDGGLEPRDNAHTPRRRGPSRVRRFRARRRRRARAAAALLPPVHGDRSGRYSPEALADVNRRAIDMLVELRPEYEAAAGAPFVISGAIGPRGDGYSAETLLEPDEAETYQAVQIGTFASTDADVITAFTMTHTGEAIGVAPAAVAAGVPVAIGFTVETGGCRRAWSWVTRWPRDAATGCDGR
ncbi:MAG: homocysteine S-methyltransferase family protein [Acidimicrobiales bacterium]